MGAMMSLRGLGRTARRTAIIGVVLLILAAAGRSWLLGLIGLALLARPALALMSTRTTASDEPWPWPADSRSVAEGMARPLDPTPKRLLPPDEKSAAIAQVATTKEELARLIAEKPPAWPWAVFASVLVQRRNAVGDRLRRCVSGYQPGPGLDPLPGRAYAQTALGAMNAVADLVQQIEQFMLSPAFKGAFGEAGTGGDSDVDADPDAIVAVADRLMDYHGAFLTQAEACLQTPVQSEALTLVQDMGAFSLIPLLSYERFIRTMCARVAEAQDLLPYAKPHAVVALDDVTLTMELPEGLSDRIVRQIRRFNRQT